MTPFILHNGVNDPESKTTHMFCSIRQVAAPGVKSAVSNCILFSCVLFWSICLGFMHLSSCTFIFIATLS